MLKLVDRLWKPCIVGTCILSGRHENMTGLTQFRAEPMADTTNGIFDWVITRTIRVIDNRHHRIGVMMERFNVNPCGSKPPAPRRRVSKMTPISQIPLSFSGWCGRRDGTTQTEYARSLLLYIQ